MPLSLIVTDAGRAAIVDAEGGGTAPVTIAQLGLSADVLAPAATDTVLAGEFKRLDTIAGAAVSADTIHLVGGDSSTDAYSVRAFALYLDDGTLFAIYGQADPIIEKVAASDVLLAFDVAFADIAAESLTFGDTDFLNPPATETVKGVAEIATQAESDAALDDSRIVTPKKARLSWLYWMGDSFGDIWRASNDGAGSGLDADLLDGQQGSYYTNIAARLGYTPLDAASYTAADVKSKLLTVDGAGSGLDADLLDGQQGSYYAAASALAGYLPLAGGNVTGALTVGTNPVLVNRNRIANLDTLTVPGTFSFTNNATGAPGAAFGYDAVGISLIDGDAGAAQRTQLVDLGPGASSGLYWRSDEGLGFGAWANIWTSATHGAGSGLDADLLDGQQGSYYTNIAARLGYTPLDAASYTAADVKSKLVTVDGAGSGIDADLLDGQQGSYYTNIAARLGYTPLDAASYTAADVKSKLLTVDGAGSGIDADLLDGKHASAFAQLASDFDSLLANNGYQKLPGGLIVQWVNVYVANPDFSVNFSWPIPFPGGVFAAIPGLKQGLTYSGSASAYLNNVTAAGARVWSNNGGGTAGTISIIAIGH